jgi:hypothetical protein
MTLYQEITVGQRWIYNTLSTNSSITALVGGALSPRIFPDYVPVAIAEFGAMLPAIVYFSYSIKDDTLAVGGIRVNSNIEFVVKAIVKSENSAVAEQIMSLVDTALHRKSGVAAEGSVISCVRRLPLDFIEANPEVVYKHLGGVYALQIQTN